MALFAKELAARLSDSNISVFAADPGPTGVHAILALPALAQNVGCMSTASLGGRNVLSRCLSHQCL